MMIEMEDLRALVSDVIELAPEQIDTDRDRDDIPGWDSLAHLRIITALETRFRVRLTMVQITEVRTVEQLSLVANAA